MRIDACIVIPVFNHGTELAATLDGLLAHALPVFLVDDGSGEPTRATLDALRARHAPQIRLVRLSRNGGKGAAVMAGLRAARAAGHTHALQIDADGQHDATDVPRFLSAMHASPDALILGCPVYDESVPKSRLYGRYATHVWVWIETLSFDIRDAMCGFRLYPLDPVCALIDSKRIGTRMDFDVEVLVRLHWMGMRIHTIRTRVTYSAGGVSHFRVWRDNIRISAMHTRLVAGMLIRAPSLVARRLRRRIAAPSWWRTAERGNALGIGVLAFCLRVFGMAITTLLLYPVVAYFVLTSRAAREASAEYLARLGRCSQTDAVPRPGWRSAFRHVLAFARSGLDKLAAWSGRTSRDDIDIDSQAREIYEEIAGSGKGALVIGSHLGNLEMTRALATINSLMRITAVVHTEHARNFNAALAHASGQFRQGVLEIGDIGPDTALALKARIDAGELLVIVGDRAPADERGRTVRVPFLGDPACFAQGPYVLAHLLQCPVYLVFCLRENDRHRLYFERFAPQIALPRKERDASIALHAERYAKRLEHYCRKAPLQWFNFYDFWRCPHAADETHGGVAHD